MIKDSKYTYYLIIFLIFCSGFGAIIDFNFPVKIIGFSLFITWIPLFISFFLFLNGLKNESKINLWFLCLYFISFLLLIFFRMIFYDEEILVNIAGQRYFFFIPFFLIGIKKQLFKDNIPVILSLLASILLVHSLNSIFHLLDFYCIDNGEQVVEFGRFKGIMGGSNVSANFIVILFLVIVSAKKNISLLLFFSLSALTILGIAPFLSRGAFLIFILTFIFRSYQLIRYSRIYLFFYSIFIFICLTNIYNNFDVINNLQSINSFINRFENGIESGREERNLYFLKLIKSEELYWFLGIDNKSMFVDDEFSISDNSFTLIFSFLGIFIGCLFFLVIYKISGANFCTLSNNLYFYLLMILIFVFFNNAVIWTSWSFIAVFGFYFVQRNSIISTKSIQKS